MSQNDKYAGSRRAWTPAEDAALQRAVQASGGKDWIRTISNAPELSARSAKSCRRRWLQHLDPQVCRKRFCERESRTVALAHVRYGGSWARIARELPGRTDNAVRNHWHSALRVQYTKILKSVLENPTVEDLQIKASLGVHDEMLKRAILQTGTIGVRRMCRWALDLTDSVGKSSNVREEGNGGGGEVTNIHFEEGISGYSGDQSYSHSGEETNGYFGGGTNGVFFDEESNEYSGEEISGYYEEPKREVCETEGDLSDIVNCWGTTDKDKESTAVLLDGNGKNLQYMAKNCEILDNRVCEINENGFLEIPGIPEHRIRETSGAVNCERFGSEVVHFEPFFENMGATAVTTDENDKNLHLGSENLRSGIFGIPENPFFNSPGVPGNSIMGETISGTVNSESRGREIALLEAFFHNMRMKANAEISMLQNALLWSMQNNRKLQISTESNLRMENVAEQPKMQMMNGGEKTNSGMNFSQASLADITRFLGLDESDTCLSIPNSVDCRTPSDNDFFLPLLDMDLREFGSFPPSYIP